MNAKYFGFLVLILLSYPLFANAEHFIKAISISADHFNPTAGQRSKITIIVARPGKITLQVVDRDGYLVRTLAADSQVVSGEHEYEWLGNTDSDPNEIVADEAYSLRIQLVSERGSEIYFPANQIAKELKPKLNYYDRKRGIVSYNLERAGRVHLQAGIAHVDEKSKEVEGAVLKTVTNRAVRGAGSIAEFWDGFADGDNTIYVPDLPNFKIAIAATELPENSIITVGNRNRTFPETIVSRKANSLFTFKTTTHQHHQGLSTLEDLSPQLNIRPINGTWDEKEHSWIPQDSTLKISGELLGANADAFSKQSGRLLVFVGEKRIVDIPKPISRTFNVNVPLQGIPVGTHILSLNSVSLNGPVGVHALRLRIDNNPQSPNSKMSGKKE